MTDQGHRIRAVARLEVLEYIRQWRAQAPEEWEYFIPIAQLSQDRPEDLSQDDLGRVYTFIAGDFKAWTVEGSPHLDWNNDREFAEAFCKAWNEGKALP